MFLKLYLPLFVIFINSLGLFFLIFFTFRGHDSHYKQIESSRAFIIFTAIQMTATFGIDYFDESLYGDYNFLYLFIVSSLVFVCIYFPILKLVPEYDSTNRFFLGFFFALLSSNVTEFAFFSIYSFPFLAWSVYLSLALLIVIISLIIIVYTHLFSQSTEKLLPFE